MGTNSNAVRALVVCLLSSYLISRYMRPEEPWQRLAKGPGGQVIEFILPSRSEILEEEGTARHAIKQHQKSHETE